MCKWLSISVGLLLFSTGAFAQADSVAARLLRIQASTVDSGRIVMADGIPDMLEKIPFATYSQAAPVKYLGYKLENSGGAELFSWAIPLEKGQMLYSWFRFKNGETVPVLIKEFNDYKGENEGWLFYDFLRFEHKKEAHYLLLGWNKTKHSNRKVVKVVRFGNGGKITYPPLLRKGNSRSSSLSFEYGIEGSMMLKHDRKGRRIIFDHLAPIDKKYEGYFMFYGPDASYDALILKNGEWWYEEGVKE